MVVCSICLNDNAEEFLTTGCGHLYHSSCLKPWLARSNMCPDCNQILLMKPFRIFCK